MQIILINSFEEFNSLNLNIIKSLFNLDKKLHYDYNHEKFAFQDWKKEIVKRFNNNVKYIILVEVEKVCGYSAFIEDEKYNNFYVKNFTLDINNEQRFTIFKIIMKEVFTYFLESKYEFLRFSTHKNNKIINKMCENKGLFKKKSRLNSTLYIYQISKEDLKKQYIHKKLFNKK